MRPLRVRDLLTVFVGASLGTLLRALAVPHADPATASWALLAVNTLGAACLGLFVALCAARSRALTLFVSVGVLGGFTSYSALSVMVVTLSRFGADSHTLSLTSVGSAVGYALLTLVAGVLAASLGLALGNAIARSRAAGHARKQDCLPPPDQATGGQS